MGSRAVGGSLIRFYSRLLLLAPMPKKLVYNNLLATLLFKKHKSSNFSQNFPFYVVF